MKNIVQSCTKAAVIIAMMLTGFSSRAQNNAAAIAAADTSNFSINAAGGWQLYNAFITPINTDSAQVELIIQHNNNINLQQEQYIGTIKPADQLPGSSQQIYFSLISNIYAMRLEPDGKCYLKLVSGTTGTEPQVVIPIKLPYKT